MNIRSFAIVAFALTLAACGDTYITQASPDTESTITELSTTAYQSSQFTVSVSDGLYNNIFIACAPQGVYPEVDVRASSMSVAIFQVVPQQEATVNCKNGRVGWTIPVYFQPYQVGESLITVNLRSDQKQKYTFIVNVQPPRQNICVDSNARNYNQPLPCIYEGKGGD